MSDARLAGDPCYAALQFVPWIGPALAAMLCAEIGDVRRLDYPAQVVAVSGVSLEEVGAYRSGDRIVIRRDQLRRPVDHRGTLLHELTHAASGHTDGALEFEDALTRQLGTIMVGMIKVSALR